MQTSLEAIGKKARTNKRHRFENLYRCLNEGFLEDSWSQLNRQASVGVDGVSYQEYGMDLHGNIHRLVQELKRKRYRAKMVRRCYIPKGNGKERPLGIPATQDKLLQHAVMRLLQAIYEEDFLPCMYGYRPVRGAHEAVHDLREALYYGDYEYVVEADIKGYFDNMDHEWMIKMLEQRINDRAFVRLIRKWLRAGVLEPNGKLIHPVTGTPQGGIISPILANIYMHYCLALWFERVVKKRCRGRAYLCVYADDFVAAFEHREDAEAFYRALSERVGKFGLELSPDKTRIIKFSRHHRRGNGTFEFLGFEYRWVVSRRGKDWLKRTTSRGKLRKSLENLKHWVKQNRHKRHREFFTELNAKLRGYYNYYGVIGNLDGLWRFYALARCILFKWLNRRSQRKSFGWVGLDTLLRRYGVERPRLVHSKIRSA